MKQKLMITTLLVTGILLLVNFVSNEIHFRADLTEDSQYTLSKATLDILKNLEEPVTIKAYFSENLPVHIAKTREDFRDLLVEYSARSGGMVVYEFLNPGENAETEQLALQNGVQAVMINVREKDQVKQQKAFLGAALSIGDRKDAIPLIQPGSSMEYALSTSIKKLAIANKPVVGFIQGHGEPPVSEMGQAYEQLSVLYNIQELRLDSAAMPEGIKTLALVRPTDSVPALHLRRIDDFLARGGRLMVALNRVQGDLQQASGRALNIGVDQWLKAKGVDVMDEFVVDAKCGSVTVQSQQGFFTMQSQVSFPYLPAIARFGKHPITQGLETVVLEFASPIVFIGDTTKKFVGLAFSSEKSGVQKAPVFFDIDKQWSDADFPLSGQVIAAAVTGKLAGDAPSKMVVIGDGDLAVNGSGQRPRNLAPDNVNLFVNSIDWLSDDTGLIDLRTKGTSTRPLREVEETSKSLIKYGNFLLPILLVIGYGVVRMQRNRIIRLKRMSENYEEGK